MEVPSLRDETKVVKKIGKEMSKKVEGERVGIGGGKEERE